VKIDTPTVLVASVAAMSWLMDMPVWVRAITTACLVGVLGIQAHAVHRLNKEEVA
jgi:hypothetical protein